MVHVDLGQCLAEVFCFAYHNLIYINALVYTFCSNVTINTMHSLVYHVIYQVTLKHRFLALIFVKDLICFDIFVF